MFVLGGQANTLLILFSPDEQVKTRGFAPNLAWGVLPNLYPQSRDALKADKSVSLDR
jgi:hypothetical protein